MEPKVIFLDFDGTISRSRFWGHWAKSSKYKETNDLIQEMFFKATPDTLTEWMRGEWSAENITDTISKAIDVPSDILLSGLRESCEQMELLNHRILPIVKRLRNGGQKVVLATDNMDTFKRWTIPALHLNEHFDSILDSHTLRALKRDNDRFGKSKFFGKFLSDNGISPTETVLVDDSASNMAVNEFGMKFIQATSDSSIESILASLSRA